MAGTLALTRRANEEVVIGPDGPDQIVIRIAKVGGEKVRLAITAPTSVGVHRREVYERMKHEGVRRPLTDDGGRDLCV